MPDVNVGTAYGKLVLRDEFTGVLRKANADLATGAQKMERDFGRIRSGAAAASTAMLGLSAAGVGAMGLLTKSAMAATESENLFTVSLGKNADAVRKWSEGLRDQLGLNSYELRRQVGMWDTMLSSIGVSEKAALSMSKSLVVLANDMASFYDLQPEVAFEKLRAGIMGEIEPLRQLGIVVDEATMQTYLLTQGIKAKTSELTQAEKSEVRYRMILEQTTKAQGDLERTKDSESNKTKILKARTEELRIELGKNLLPAYSKLLDVGNDVVGWLSRLTDEQKKSYTQWVLYGTVTVGATGVLTKMTLALPGIIAGLGTIRAILLTPVGGAGTLAAAAAGLAIWHSKQTIDQMQHDAAAGSAGPTTIMDPRTGKPMAAPPRWQMGDALPSGFGALAAAGGLPIAGVRGSAYAAGAVNGSGKLPPLDITGRQAAPKGRTGARGQSAEDLRQRAILAGEQAAAAIAGLVEERRRFASEAFSGRRRRPLARYGGEVLAGLDEATFYGTRDSGKAEVFGSKGAVDVTAGGLTAGRFGYGLPSLPGSPEVGPRIGSYSAGLAAFSAAMDTVNAGARVAGQALSKQVAAGLRESAEAAVEWRREWQRLGSGIFDASRGGAGGLLRGLGNDAQGRGLGKALAALSQTGLGKWVGRNKGLISGIAGVAGGVSSISQGEGGWFGGAMSGAGIAAMLGLGPIGIGISALAGAIFSGNAEDERRHREAQRQREETNRELQRQTHALTQTLDLFRSGSMNLLPSSMTTAAAVGAR